MCASSFAVRAAALSWADNVPGWFPCLRPAGEVLTFAEGVAHELGPNDGRVPADAIARGVALLPPEEPERLAREFAALQPEEWAAVCADCGDVPALERALAAGAVRCAIIERRLPPPKRLSDLERGAAPAGSPHDVLVVTLPPEVIWSAVDFQAAREHARRAHDERGWSREIDAVARARSRPWQVERVRVLAAALDRRRPAPAHPRASALLRAAYRRVQHDAHLGESVVRSLLAIYVAQETSYITSDN